MEDRREALLAVLETLAGQGQAADRELVAEEHRRAALEHVPTDEQFLQKLGALSRELWAAHDAVHRALRASVEIRMLQTDSGGADQ